MAVRVAEKPEYVARCVPRQDGGWMVITAKGNTGSSPTEMREGAQVVIRDGLAVRPS